MKFLYFIVLLFRHQDISFVHDSHHIVAIRVFSNYQLRFLLDVFVLYHEYYLEIAHFFQLHFLIGYDRMMYSITKIRIFQSKNKQVFT